MLTTFGSCTVYATSYCELAQSFSGVADQMKNYILKSSTALFFILFIFFLTLGLAISLQGFLG